MEKKGLRVNAGNTKVMIFGTGLDLSRNGLNIFLSGLPNINA